jgi:hypothetical protein
MYNNEFEQQVRKKMEALHFTPSDPVWQGIQATIQKNKRRRRALFIALLFIGLGGGFWANNEMRNNTNWHIATVDQQTKINQFSGSFLENTKVSTQAIAPNWIKKDRVKQLAILSHNTRRVFNSRNEVVFNNNVWKKIKYKATVLNNDLDGNLYRSHTAIIQKGSSLVMPLLEKEQAAFVDAPKMGMSLTNTLFLKSSFSSKKSIQKNKWKWYATASVGLSGLHTPSNPFAVFGINKINNNDGQDAVGVFPPIQPLPVLPSSQLGFKVGISAERTVCKKISVAVGLNYSSYNVQILAGNLLNSYQQPLLVAPNNLSANPSTLSYYANRTTTTYTNHYRFLQLPVAMNIGLGNSKRLPVKATVGVSVNYLIRSRAIEYDELNGVFYKNKQAYQRVQLAGRVGISVTLSPSTKHPLVVGPEVDMSFTSLLKQPGSQRLMFNYAGLTTSFLLGSR